MNRITKIIRGMMGVSALALVLGMGVVPTGTAVSQGVNGTDMVAGTQAWCPPICP